MGPVLRFTIREAVRKRLVMLVLLLTLGFLGLYGWGVHQVLRGTRAGEAALYRAGEAAALLSVGLYFASFLTAFLTIVMTSGAIAGEVELGTVYAVLARPISRRDFVLGKFCGYLLLSLVYGSGLYLAVLALVRPYLPVFSEDVLASLGIFLLQPLTLAALTVAVSSCLSTLNTGVLMVSLYGLGIVGGMLEQIGMGLRQPALVNIGILSSLIMPADAIYRKAGITLFATLRRLVNLAGNPFLGGSEPSAAMLLYTVIYALAVLGFAIYTFEKRDI